MPSSSTARPGICSISLRVVLIARSVSPSSFAPVHERLPPGRVERAREQAAGARGFDQADAAVDHGGIDPPARAEVQHRRLGQAADDLVGGGGDEVGAAGERVGRQRRVEVQVRPPGLVDDQRHTARVRHLGQRGDIGAGPEVGGGDDHRCDCARRRLEPGRQRLGRQAVRDPQLGVELGGDEGRPHPAQHQPVDHRGVDVALDDHAIATVRERHAGGVVALRGAVDEEPGALRPPGPRREQLGLLERRRFRTDVHPLGYRRDVVAEANIADQLPHRRVGSGAALVPGHLEAPRVELGVSEQGIDIRSRVLIAISHRLRV